MNTPYRSARIRVRPYVWNQHERPREDIVRIATRMADIYEAQARPQKENRP